MKLSLLITLGALAQPSLASRGVPDSKESPRAVAKVIESFNGVFEALSDEVGDFDDYEDEEFDVSNEGSEDMMLMKGGDSSNFMQMSKESDDKKKKTNKSKRSSNKRSRKRSRSSRKRSRRRRSRRRSYSRNYRKDMCGRHMRSRDRRLCESLERKFCDSSRDFRRNERFCEELGFRYYEFDGDEYELIENSDNSGSSAEDFDFEFDNSDTSTSGEDFDFEQDEFDY